jgi:EpsI family protein
MSVNQLTAVAPGRYEQILYWTRVGDAMPSTWKQQRLTTALANLNGLIPDAVLARVSTIDPDHEGAFARLADFVERMIEALPQDRRKVLAVRS